MLWQQVGLSLSSVVDMLVDLALERHQRRRGLRTHR
jgi:hypothetical protein